MYWSSHTGYGPAGYEEPAELKSEESHLTQVQGPLQQMPIAVWTATKQPL